MAYVSNDDEAGDVNHGDDDTVAFFATCTALCRSNNKLHTFQKKFPLSKVDNAATVCQIFS